MDAVQYCMDNLSGQVQPWFQVKADGSLAFSQNAINGFIGGSVGVVGTVISTLIKKGEVKDRLKCLYCNGSGQITCGHCLGTGMVKLSATESVACSNCEGTGTVVCINCQGSGLSVPDEFLQVLGDEEARRHARPPRRCRRAAAALPPRCCPPARPRQWHVPHPLTACPANERARRDA
jgi:hypothetical protein